MPIELWWWVKPLFSTGVLTAIICLLAATLLDKMRPNYLASAIIAFIGILPLLICGASFIVWLVANLLILIWGC